jgi:hypothetical protein
VAAIVLSTSREETFCTPFLKPKSGEEREPRENRSIETTWNGSKN